MNREVEYLQKYIQLANSFLETNEAFECLTDLKNLNEQYADIDESIIKTQLPKLYYEVSDLATNSDDLKGWLPSHMHC